MTDPRSGARDNGLRCAGYAAIGDLDPRIAEAMLDALRDHGVAAYTTPTPGTRGGFHEVQLPAELTNRLFVDSAKVEQARKVVNIERAEGAERQPQQAAGRPGDDTDIDTAWQQLLVSLQTPTTEVTPSWPSSENIPAGTEGLSADLASIDMTNQFDMTDLEDEHFVPPPAPPLPKLRPVTIGSLAAIIGGILVLVTQVDDGAWDWIAIIAIIVGGASLVWNVKQGPPTDSDWDDGAVV